MPVRPALAVQLVSFVLARLVLSLLASGAFADVPAEPLGRSLTLPEPNDHQLWVGDTVLRRSALWDTDRGRMLGLVNGGQGVGGVRPHLSRERGEIYVIETVYSRAHRGERTDVVTIYDDRTLAVLGEVVIPPKRADNGNGVALGGVLDDRFLAVFNQTPATSVSIVDLEARAFATEIPTGGCALVYPSGPRSFGQLCGDGTAQRIDLDEAGREAARYRSEPFFDAKDDPITEKGAHVGDSRWLFSSFEGFAYTIDFGTQRPTALEPWSLFSDDERDDGWRIGGNQHLAIHRATGRLFSIVHEGKKGSHKDSGPEVWVYDLARRERIQVIEPSNLTAAFLRGLAGVKPGTFTDWLMRTFLPTRGAASVAVSQDAAPLLYLGDRQLAGVGVHDALTGEHLRDLDSTGLSGGLLVVP